jgi:hypothetical protein
MQADYSSGTPTAATNNSTQSNNKTGKYWGHDKLKRAYTDYLGNKREEIDEQKDARRYYHGSQWTAAQIKALKKRKQPITTYNRIGRKIDGVVGVLERLRQDPKAFPRTPQHEEGADLATACIRYVLDQQEWTAKSAEAARDGAIEGIAGIELNLVQGDHGDPEIELDIVEPDSFFYDPRSYRADFSDARYMGVAKWIDLDLAKEMFPDKEEELDASVQDGTEFTTNPDRENKWFDTTRKNIRLVDCWYKHGGEWCYTIFTGSTILMEGGSYLIDEKKKTECKYIMYSASIDHDGDRYGFVRNMRSVQDSVNFKQSKLNHILASRRLIMTNAAVMDVEKARAEWARPDGVVLVNPGGEVKADDQSFDFAGWDKLLQNDKTEIENFGPNPAVLGEGVENSSGRAISLLQQAGIAELGPYISAYKGWKVRVYRAVWNAIQRHWSAERWIRVTDDDNVAQFIQINGMGIDPNTGMPTIVNGLGSLDVDIIIDEGPDTVNMMADTYEALLALASSGAQVPPAVLIELSPGIDSRTKKKVLEMIQQAQQPGPAQQLEMAAGQAKVAETQANAGLKKAQTVKTLIEAQQPQEIPQAPAIQPQQYEPPPHLQDAKVMAEIDKTQASAEQSRATAYKTIQEAELAPMKMAQEATDREQDRKMRSQMNRSPAR